VLPQLNHLRCSLEHALVILRPLPNNPQVRRIQLYDPASERDLDDFYRLLGGLPHLERLEFGMSISPAHLKRIAGSARGLNWLRVSTSSTMNKFYTKVTPFVPYLYPRLSLSYLLFSRRIGSPHSLSFPSWKLSTASVS
jgi:hypothetical protein